MSRGAGVRAFELSFLELDVLGDALGLNVRPFPFTGRFPVHGELVEDRKRLVGVAAESLAAKGLVGAASFAPEVERLVGLFARGRVSVAMLGTAGQRLYCVRAAVEGSTGVIVRQRGELVLFTPVTPESLAHNVIGLIEPLKPGPGSSVVLTVPDGPATRREDGDDFSGRSYLESVRPTRTSEGAQWAVADQVARRPRLGSGYLTVTERGRGGRESEPQTMTWVDTDVGRYAILPGRGSDGRRHVTYLPADLGRLEHNLARLVAALL